MLDSSIKGYYIEDYKSVLPGEYSCKLYLDGWEVGLIHLRGNIAKEKALNLKGNPNTYMRDFRKVYKEAQSRGFNCSLLEPYLKDPSASVIGLTKVVLEYTIFVNAANRVIELAKVHNSKYYGVSMFGNSLINNQGGELETSGYVLKSEDEDKALLEFFSNTKMGESYYKSKVVAMAFLTGEFNWNIDIDTFIALYEKD